jgi:hypothetical protein
VCVVIAAMQGVVQAGQGRTGRRTSEYCRAPLSWILLYSPKLGDERRVACGV